MNTVARNVSPHATAAQCQNRWCKSLDPALQRGAWTEEEDDRLRKAVAGYGSSWVQVASAIPGRTNDQCRERWHEHLNQSTEKSAWTEAEDNILLENVKMIGNRWKTISLIIGNNRTGPIVSPHVWYQNISCLQVRQCRLRYDKLMKLRNGRNRTTPSPSNTGPQPVSTTLVSEDGPSLTTQTQSCLSSVEVSSEIPLPIAKPRPKPRPKGKEKAKETIVELEQNAGPVPSLPEKAIETVTIGESQTTCDGSTTMPSGMTAPKLVLKPRPITRAKGKSAAVGRVRPPTTTLENVPASGAPSSSSENKPNASRSSRGSKRGIVAQLDEVPVAKRRKTRASKPGSTSELVDPGITAASMPLPQSAESTSLAANEIMEVEPDPRPTTKMTLRKRKK